MTRPRLRRGVAVAALLGAAGLGGCSSSPEEGRVDPFEPRAAHVFVEVRNQYEMEVLLHAYGPGLRERLGSLGPGRSRVWRVPWTDVGDIRVRVEPSTGPHLESNALTVRPGQGVLFTVASEIGRSVLIYR